MKKVAIVTGASGGIGFAVVRQLVSDGYTVSAMSRTPFEKLAGQFAPLGDAVRYHAFDVTKAEDRAAVVERTAEEFGRIDALVNVAGVAPSVRADLLDMTEESFDRVLNVNTKATMFLTQLAARRMLSQQPIGPRRGVIVNISSISAYTSSTSRGEYCVSKAGISMLTKLYADRLAAEGIAVFEVRPGIIKTQMTSSVEAKYDAMIEKGVFPIARWGMPEDVADAVSVLCGDKLLYSTGDVLNVDGGFHLRRL